MISGSQKFKPGDNIRRIIDPKILAYVIYVNKFHTQAVDLMDNEPIKHPFVILEFEYPNWEKDILFEYKDTKERDEWQLQPLS